MTIDPIVINEAISKFEQIERDIKAGHRIANILLWFDAYASDDRDVKDVFELNISMTSTHTPYVELVRQYLFEEANKLRPQILENAIARAKVIFKASQERIK